MDLAGQKPCPSCTMLVTGLFAQGHVQIAQREDAACILCSRNLKLVLGFRASAQANSKVRVRGVKGWPLSSPRSLCFMLENRRILIANNLLQSEEQIRITTLLPFNSNKRYLCPHTSLHHLKVQFARKKEISPASSLCGMRSVRKGHPDRANSCSKVRRIARTRSSVWILL